MAEAVNGRAPDAQKVMQPAQRLLAAALAVASLTACGQPKGFDELKLRIVESGEVPLVTLPKRPARVGEITSWRTSFPGQVFAAVKTEAPCPRDIHAMSGAIFRKDRIELCFTATPRNELVPGFACSPQVYLKYEIMGMPADVEPRFAFVGACVSPGS